MWLLKACAQAPCQAEARGFIITHLILPQVQKPHVGFGQYVKKKKAVSLSPHYTRGFIKAPRGIHWRKDTFEEFHFF